LTDFHKNWHKRDVIICYYIFATSISKSKATNALKPNIFSTVYAAGGAHQIIK
jgi:hypothetical protein